MSTSRLPRGFQLEPSSRGSSYLSLSQAEPQPNPIELSKVGRWQIGAGLGSFDSLHHVG